jgi:hypothetical protein
LLAVPCFGQIINPGGSGAGSGTPSDPVASVQFNSSGSFGGDSALTWDNTNKLLNVGVGYISTTTPAAGNAMRWNGSAYAVTTHGTDYAFGKKCVRQRHKHQVLVVRQFVRRMFQLPTHPTIHIYEKDEL